MLILVTGGAASGKSEYAEQLVLQSSIKPRIYLATMRPWDDECHARITKHQAMRAEKEFTTVECFQNLISVQVPQGADVLLECMSNLVANEMFDTTESNTNVCDRILSGIAVLKETAERVIVVSNEVFSDGIQYDPATTEYLKTLGAINSALAEQGQRVVEVVCGIPVIWKGEKTHCVL